MSVKTHYQHIVRTPDIAGGKPRIDGHRITVQQIAIWHEQMGYSVDEIATLYNLTLSEIHSALAYYYDHREEIDTATRESEAFAEALRQETPSLLAQKFMNGRVKFYFDERAGASASLSRRNGELS
jgi:uncharacterized protein (DUF433 family)